MLPMTSRLRNKYVRQKSEFDEFTKDILNNTNKPRTIRDMSPDDVVKEAERRVSELERSIAGTEERISRERKALEFWRNLLEGVK